MYTYKYYMPIYTYIHMYMYAYVCTCIQICRCIHMCICVYIYIDKSDLKCFDKNNFSSILDSNILLTSAKIKKQWESCKK